jgi:hypothetical protein
MDTDEEMLVLMLAYGIDTYGTIARTLDQMDLVTGAVPYSLRGQVRRHLRDFAMQWWATVHGDPTWLDEHLDACVREAGEWLTTHQDQLEELIRLRSSGD